MRKIPLKLKKAVFYLSFALATVAPIAVAVSCGESTEQAPQTYREKIVDNLTKASYFGTGAVSTNTTPQSIPLDPIAKEYKYLSGSYLTLESAKAAPDSEWKTSLPASVAFKKSSRNLWLRIIPRTVSELETSSGIKEADILTLSGDKQYLDLTEISKIQKIRSDVADTPEYRAFSLGGITISGTLEAPQVNTSIFTLPEGTKFEFLINGIVVPGTNLISYIQANKATLTAALLSNVQARLGVSDDSLYFLETPKTSPITSTIPFTPTVSALNGALLLIEAATSSDNTAVSWTGVQGVASSMPASIDKVEYYAGTEDTGLAVLDNTGIAWSATLPTTISADHQTRNLWARITPVSGSNISQQLVNLTSSSKVRDVKTLINIPTNQLSSIALTGTLAAPVIQGVVNLPPSSAVEYQIKGNWYSTLSDFLAYIRAISSEITVQDLSSVKMRYVPANKTLYKVSNAYETIISNNIKIVITPSATLNAALGNIRALSTSRNNAVAWDGLAAVTSSKPSEINTIKFYSGPITTVALVAAAPETEWKDILPTTVGPTHNSRYLYARLTPANGYAIANPIIDLTTASKVRDVITLINVPSLALNTITYSVNNRVTTINTKGITTPENTVLQFQFNNDGVWRSQSNFITYVNGLTTPLTSTSYQNTKVRVAPTDEILFSVDNDRQSTISIIIVSYRDGLAKRLGNTTFFGESISTAVVPATISIDAVASSYQYLSGEYETTEAVSAAPSASWSTSLPTSVAYDKSKRNLWVKVVPRTLSELGSQTTITAADIESFSGNKQYISVTDASGIRNIKSDIAQQPNFGTYSMIGNSITGTTAAPILKLDAVSALPDTKIEFVFKNNVYDQAALATYIQNNKQNLARTDWGNIKFRLVVLDTRKFALRTPKEGFVDATAVLRISTQSEWERIYPSYVGKIVGDKLIDGAFLNGGQMPVGFALPDNVIEIGPDAFSGVTFSSPFAISSRVSVIREDSFKGVDLSKGFKISSSVVEVYFWGFRLAVLPFGFSVPSTVTSSDTRAFRDAKYPDGSPYVVVRS